MALISTSSFSGGQFLIRTGLTVNTRASHTICFRVKHGSTATNYSSYCAGYYQTTGTFGNGGSYMGRANGGAGTALKFWRENDVGTESPSGGQNPTGFYGNTASWLHVAFVYNATSGVFRTYIDGVFSTQSTSATTAAPSSTSNTIALGLHNGKFADFAFFDRALSDSEVTDMADYRVPQVTSGLTIFCRLDSNGNDSSGNGFNLSTTGSAPNISYSTSDNPPQPETPVVAIAGNAASASALSGLLTKAFAVSSTGFASASALTANLGVGKRIAGDAATASALTGDIRVGMALAGNAASASALDAWLRPRWGRRTGGSGADLSTSALSIPATSPFTIMAWARAFTPMGSGASVTLTTPATVFVRLRVRTNAGTPQCWLLLNDGTNVLSHIATDDQQWHHYAITYDGATARAYVDGSQVASATPSMSGTFDAMTIDGDASSVAEFAHVKLWTAALSAGEVASEGTYYTPHTQNAALYGWWQLSWQDVHLDSSGNGHTLLGSGSTEARTESPGAPMLLLSGTAASASALQGQLSQAQPLTGASATASALAATLTVSVALAGGASTASALEGQLHVAKALAGDAASASELSGTLSQAQPLVGNAATASALSGTLLQVVGLAGGAASASALTGELHVAKPLAGDAHSGSALAGTLGVTGTFEGHAHSGSMLEGTLGVLRQIAGDASTASALTGVLSQLQPLLGDAVSASALSGTLSVSANVPLAGGAATASALSGELGVELPISGHAGSASQLSATLFVGQSIAGNAHTASALSGDLRVGNTLQGTAATASALTGTLSVVQALAGGMHSSSGLGGNLNVNVFWHLQGAAWTASYLSGALTVTVPAAAIGSNVTDGIAMAYYEESSIPSPRSGRRWPPRY